MRTKVGRHTSLVVVLGLAVVLGAALMAPSPTKAATGDLVGSVTFSVDCSNGANLGVGIAFDGTNLWYSCYAQTTDLYKANAITGQVITSFNVKGGLGALAWDSGRGKLWAGAGCAPGQTGSEVYLIDPSSGVGTLQFNIPTFTGGCLDDGLAYDGTTGNDSIYHSWDGATTIRHLSAVGGVPLGDDNFPWGGNACYNSGLAIGGSLLYQGSNGCSTVWVVDKGSKAPQFNFSTIVAGDPNFRDEDLECDTNTFASLGKQVMWSKEAYNPQRAHAFEVPAGSCGIGGQGVTATPVVQATSTFTPVPPTSTPTPRPPLGGVAGYPNPPSGGNNGLLLVMASLAAGLLALSGAGWFARRHWL